MNESVRSLPTRVKMRHFQLGPKTSSLPILIRDKPTNYLKQYPTLKNTKPAQSTDVTIAPTQRLNALPLKPQWQMQKPQKNPHNPYITWADERPVLDLVIMG